MEENREEGQKRKEEQEIEKIYQEIKNMIENL